MPALILVVIRFFRAVFNGLKQPEFQALTLSVLSILIAGVWFYMRYEGWSFVDALYFCVITLTTVGYGDFSPQTDIGKIFTVFYILLGLGLLAAFIGAIAQQFTETGGESRPRLRRPSNGAQEG